MNRLDVCYLDELLFRYYSRDEKIKMGERSLLGGVMCIWGQIKPHLHSKLMKTIEQSAWESNSSYFFSPHVPIYKLILLSNSTLNLPSQTVYNTVTFNSALIYFNIVCMYMMCVVAHMSPFVCRGQRTIWWAWLWFFPSVCSGDGTRVTWLAQQTPFPTGPSLQPQQSSFMELKYKCIKCSGFKVRLRIWGEKMDFIDFFST